MTSQTLQNEIALIIDPTLNKTLQEVSGLKRFFIDESGIVEVDIYLKDINKDQSSVKLQVIKLVKIKYQHRGIKVNFFQSTYQDTSVKAIQYIGVISGKGGGEKVANMLGVDVLGKIPFHYGESFIDKEGFIHNMYVEIVNKLVKAHV